MTTFNINNDGPTIIYPNGGETFYEGQIEITWTEPSGISDTDSVWYELFLTDQYSHNTINNLVKVAIINRGNTSYTYRIPKHIKSDNCRVGIRAINQYGVRSRMSFSASNFRITNKALPMPSVVEPIPNGNYFSYIPFIFDHSSIVGRASSRAYYQIYARSDDRELDWFLVMGDIRVGADPIKLDVTNFQVASDYQFKFILSDGDNVSLPVLVENVTINNVNYFLIDTLPPKGSVTIQNNQEYTNQRELILNLRAFDETTGVKEYSISQLDLNNNSIEVSGPFLDYSLISTWQIPNASEDGPKLIQANFKDYAGNEASGENGTKYFRTYKDINNTPITSFLQSGQDIYYTFESNSNGAVPSYLYKNSSLLSELQYDVTEMVIYNGLLYLAAKDDENKGILQVMSGSGINTVRDNTEEYIGENYNSLYYSDSVINSMVVFDGKLFMGMQNGRLISFNGSTISVENEDFVNEKSITKIGTDNIFLYVFFENSDEFYAMYVNTEGSYVFESMSL